MKGPQDFNKKSKTQKPLTMITCYDFTFAALIQKTSIDMILVGDSAAMTMHGYETTIPATMEMLKLHTQAVRKGALEKFIVADLPFMSTRKGIRIGVENSEALIRAGANAVKIEGVLGHEKLIPHLVQGGIPVMGHLGLTPQHVHQLGGFKVQGKTSEAQDIILRQAQELEKLGCFAIVLECVPENLAEKITQALSIPTIGIGAGAVTDGQVLVMQDLLGLNPNFKAKFTRHFLQGASLIENAIEDYCIAVREQTFPNQKETFHG